MIQKEPERAGAAQPGEEKVQGVAVVYVNNQLNRINMKETDRYPVTGEEIMCTNSSTGNTI